MFRSEGHKCYPEYGVGASSENRDPPDPRRGSLRYFLINSIRLLRKRGLYSFKNRAYIFHHLLIPKSYNLKTLKFKNFCAIFILLFLSIMNFNIYFNHLHFIQTLKINL